MASEVDICNQALIFLGAKTITSMTEDSDRARTCNALYEDLRDEVLQSFPWNCAIYRQQLAQSSSSPVYGYDYQYQLPTDPLCLRVLEMKEGLDANGGYPWEIEGQYLVTDSETCTIKYLRQITDVTRMHPLLRAAIAGRLAAEGCFKITGSKAKEKDAWGFFAAKISEARARDAMEASPEQAHPDSDEDWLSSRR